MSLRIATLLSFVAVAVLFVQTLRYMNESLSPGLVRARLENESQLVALNPWSVTFLRCAEGRAISESDCVPAGKDLDQVSFPARDALASAVAEAARSLQDGERLVARLSHPLSPSEHEWLATRKHAVLMFPRSVQNKVTFPGREATTTGFGKGQNVEIPLELEDLNSGSTILAYFDLTGFPWFGPVSHPAVLIEPDAAFDYGSLPVRQSAASGLLRQLMVGFPLVLASMAFIIDHSLSFLLLSFYGVAGAVRSFIPVLAAQWGHLPLWLELTYLAFCGLSAAFLVQFVLAIAGHWKPSLRWRLALTLAPVLAFPSVRLFHAGFYVVADLWCDGVAGVLCLFVLLASGVRVLFLRFRPESTPGDSEAPQSAAVERARSLFELRDAVVLVRNGILFFGIAVNVWANASDIWIASDASNKGFLDWKHALLLPVLIAASLVEVGSVSRKIKAVSKEVEEKARLDEELSIARDYQRKNLPSMRSGGVGWVWRAWFRPASFLGGDWFDFRELTFSDGNRLIVVGIADITGHGVAAALFTTIVSSVWSLWCDEVERSPVPADAAARERLLATLPLRMHDALLSCRKEGSGTAAFCLICPATREMTYLTAGHPALVSVNAKGVESLRTMNPALGHGDKKTEVAWTPASRNFSEEEVLFLYTDGLLPPGMNANAWMGQLRRGRKGEGFSVPLAFLRRLRETRRLYRNQQTDEDDVTILMLDLSGAPF